MWGSIQRYRHRNSHPIWTPWLFRDAKSSTKNPYFRRKIRIFNENPYFQRKIRIFEEKIFISTKNLNFQRKIWIFNEKSGFFRESSYKQGRNHGLFDGETPCPETPPCLPPRLFLPRACSSFPTGLGHRPSRGINMNTMALTRRPVPPSRPGNCC